MSPVTTSGTNSHPIKVLVLENEFNMGGSEKKLFDFIERVDADRVRVSVCCLKSGGYFRDPLKALGVPFHEGLLRHRFDVAAMSRLAGVLRREQPDVIYTFAHPNTVLLAWMARAQGLVRHFVVSFHAMGNPQGGRLVPSWLRPFLYDADALLAVAKTHREYLVATERLPFDGITVIHNGVDTVRYHPASEAERSASRNMLGLETDDVVVAHVASLKAIKRQGWLLEAAAPHLRMHRRTHILFAGDGPDRAPLEDLAVALGVASQVHFLGIRGDVERVLHASDAFVLPSSTEVFPNVVLEAMASGLPILSTNVGSVREMVEAGRSALVVPRDDRDALAAAFDTMASDEALRRSMGTRGRQIALSQFPIEGMCDKRARLFDRLVRYN